MEFQSTLPLRGATVYTIGAKQNQKNFNPRSPYGERLVWSDMAASLLYFNPRSPYGERL